MAPCKFLMIETNFQTRQYKLNLHAILASVSEAIVPFIASSKTSHHAWIIFQKTYANKSRSRIMSLKEHMFVIQRDDLILYTLNGVGPDYKEIAAAIKARDTCISFEDLHGKLTDFESYLAKSTSMGFDVSIATVNAMTKSRQPQHRNRGSYSNKNQPAMSRTNLGQHGEIRDLTSLVSSVNCVKILGMLQRNITEPKKSYLELRQQTIQLSLLQQLKDG
ncbi:hypothetical protein KY284_016422 [Solanum tuberosum]|nr:hypothetical protein KY284_016422 [Solanum tuberosum]